MSKTITISDETYKLIKDQVDKDNVKEKQEVGLEIKTMMGSLLFKSSKTTMKEAVQEAVSKYANLEDANLEYANLKGANLEGANTKYCKVNFSPREYEQARQFIEGLKE